MLVRWTCEVVSVSAWMMLCSVSATVGSGGKVTVDNFAGGPVCGGSVQSREVDGHSCSATVGGTDFGRSRARSRRSSQA